MVQRKKRGDITKKKQTRNAPFKFIQKRKFLTLIGGCDHKMTLTPNFDHFWVVCEGWSQILPWTKLFRHGNEQSCSAMATQMLEGKVQSHNEDAKSCKTSCRSLSRNFFWTHTNFFSSALPSEAYQAYRGKSLLRKIGVCSHKNQEPIEKNWCVFT